MDRCRKFGECEYCISCENRNNPTIKPKLYIVGVGDNIPSEQSKQVYSPVKCFNYSKLTPPVKEN